MKLKEAETKPVLDEAVRNDLVSCIFCSLCISKTIIAHITASFLYWWRQMYVVGNYLKTHHFAGLEGFVELGR